MDDLDAAIPLVGLAAIRFGITSAGIERLVGPPEVREIDTYGDIEFRYPSQQLSFTFWTDEGSRLGVITSERPGLSLSGRRLQGLSEGFHRI